MLQPSLLRLAPVRAGALPVSGGQDVTTALPRSGRVSSPLYGFADEVTTLAERVRSTRFRDSERYVIDADQMERDLTDLAARMRRVASEALGASARDEHAALIGTVFGGGRNRMDSAPVRRPIHTAVADQHGRRIPVERRR